MKTIIGIDPGVNGGIAWITDGKPCVEKMPDTLQDLWDLLCDIKQGQGLSPGLRLSVAVEGCKAYIEQVHVAPSFAKSADGKENTHRMGAKSAFTFGRGYGNLEMALVAAGIPFERVLPRKWQTALGCLTKGDKNVSKRRAQELYPQLKITHATADALLIATYGTKQ
jgi:hypothetical protein